MSFIYNKVFILTSGVNNLYRERIKLPIIRFISDTIELYKQRTIRQANNVRDVFFRGSIIAFVVSLLIWLSILMYIAFYYAYVPYVSHSRPVHLQFKPCEKESCTRSETVKSGICSFPSAHVQLTKRNQLLMLGQPYKIYLNLEMPESPANKDLGMFMVCAHFRSKTGALVENSCRSAMLQYHSPLLNILRTVVFSPGLLLGTSNQHQNVYVELFSDYEDDNARPATDVYIEIQSHSIELYSATLLISAHFSGLRYLMFHWPILSASIGISSNLFVIALVSIISWYQLIHSEEYTNYRRIREARKKKNMLDCKELDDSSSSLDDASMLEDSSRAEVEEKFDAKLSRDFVDILASDKSGNY